MITRGTIIGSSPSIDKPLSWWWGETWAYIHVIFLFGIPRVVIFGNGTEFTRKAFQDLCSTLFFKCCFTSVTHLQSNGQVEIANKLILLGLQTRIIALGNSLLEELDCILLSFYTIPRESTGGTPLSLIYGTEALLPIGIGLPLAQSILLKEQSDVAQPLELNLIEERKLKPSKLWRTPNNLWHNSSIIWWGTSNLL